MKTLAFILFYIVITPFCYGQTGQFSKLLSKAKAEFSKEDPQIPNYGAAIIYLNKAIKLNPRNAEAHYYLAYAYSRYNSSDATTIPDMKLHFVIKTTNELQKVISLSPAYKGPFLILDPYSKLSSEWGSLAIGYQARNQADSALWALKEGKKHGGFDEFILSANRAVLNSCSKDAILVASGDNYTLTLNYLQQAEGLRRDVTVVDIAMLNTVWYPRMLQKQSNIDFGISGTALDTLNYRSWADSAIFIPTKTGVAFAWVMKPSYQKSYVLRGDRLFLALLQQNQFKRDVYFTKGFATTDQLGLDNSLLNYAMVNKVNFGAHAPLSVQEYLSDLRKYEATFKPANKNSKSELFLIDLMRYDMMALLRDDAVNTDADKVTQVIDALNTCIPQSKYPCTNAELRDALSSINK